jgi:hypothetical protein
MTPTDGAPILETLNDGVIIADESGHILSVLTPSSRK